MSAPSKSAPKLPAHTLSPNTLLALKRFFLRTVVLLWTILLSLLETVGKYKRLAEVIKIHGRSHDNLNRSIEAAESNKAVPKSFAVPESTPWKKSKTLKRPTSLTRFKATFLNDEDESSSDYCIDSDSRFCAVKEFSFWRRWEERYWWRIWERKEDSLKGLVDQL